MRHLFSKLPEGTVVQGCTEHTRADQYLFRAHPAFRSECPWHDWALFKWTAESLAEEHEEEFDGMKARIIQHEYDHIEGKLFIDYLTSLKKRMIKGKLTNISKGIVKVDYRMSFPAKK